jgi:hypothetical protein
LSFPNKPLPPRLDSRLVWDGCDALGNIVLEANRPGLPGRHRHALQVLGNALLLGLLRLDVVVLDALEEVLPRAGQADVLDADVYALLEVPVSNLLVAAILSDCELAVFFDKTYRMTPTADFVTL